MEQPEDKNLSQRPPALIIIGFLVVISLILIGLFLPPISLGQRLGLGGNDSPETSDTVVEDIPESPEGIQISTQAQLAAGSITSLTPAEFAASADWAAALAALPASLTPASNIYAIVAGADGMNGQVALTLPASLGGDAIVDLYGWNGSVWVFMASQLDPNMRQLVSRETRLPAAVAIMQTAAATAPQVGAEVLPTQSLPVEVLPFLTEVTVGSLTLSGDGGLQGEVVNVPNGAYDQLLRVTNTGAMVDQASLSALLQDAPLQASVVNMLLGQMQVGNFAGVNLDLQGALPEQTTAFTSFADSLAQALHGQGQKLAVTLDAPILVNGRWDSGGQDWAALGQLADTIYLKMPLDPTAYDDGGLAEQLIGWTTQQVSRHKLMISLSANAIDRIGESILEMSNDQALANFGELQFVQGDAEVEPGSAIEVALSGTASPLEWDGASLTYKCTYQKSGQTHQVWLGSEAALGHQLRFANRYQVRGITVRGLGTKSAGAGYANAISYYLGTVQAPQPLGAAIVWTVRSEDGSVLASSSGDVLTFTWEGTEQPGSYDINADFAVGETVANLDTLQVAVMAREDTQLVAEESSEEPEPAEEEAPEPEATPEPAETATPPATIDPGDADAVVNVAANVRVGPGLTYGTIAGGLQPGSKVSVIGRNSDANWIQIILPDGKTEGWIFVTLITINPAIDVAALAVVQVDPPVVAGGGNGGGSNTAPPPVSAPPVTNSGFELGGQTHSFGNPTLMSYAGMNWVKFQHKWSPGDGADVVAGRIQQAHANGFKVLLSIPGADHSSIDYSAYANFLAGVAALGPDAIEVWNEMNIDREWPAGQIDPASYVNNMLAPAYNAIKGANSRVMVISGAPAPTGFFGGCGGGGCNDDLYMAGMAAAGAARYLDCLGIHYNEGIISPNQTSGDPRNPSNHYTRYFWGMVNTYWNAFGGSRPLCFTELGYLSGADYGGLPGGFAWAGNTTISQHAQWLAEAASLSASSGRVRLMIVFNVDFTTFGADPQAGYAMIRRDGGCPACETLRQVMGGG